MTTSFSSREMPAPTSSKWITYVLVTDNYDNGVIGSNSPHEHEECIFRSAKLTHLNNDPVVLTPFRRTC